MKGTLLYVFPNLQGRSHPFETDTKGRLFVVDISIDRPSSRNWRTKVLDSWKVFQRIYLVRKVLTNERAFPVRRVSTETYGVL